MKAARSKNDISLFIKISYTLFMCILVPYYWKTYGPINFLFMCDLALFLTLGAVWLESPLMAGMAAVGILLPQCVWIIDVCVKLLIGLSTGMTDYMFRESIPPFAKLLSLYHVWLPILLLYLIFRKGYDRRAPIYLTMMMWPVLVVCYLFTPPPSPEAANIATPVNINYVFGFTRTAPQTLMHPHLYFSLIMVGLPMLVYMPTHKVLTRIDNMFPVNSCSATGGSPPQADNRNMIR